MHLGSDHSNNTSRIQRRLTFAANQNRLNKDGGGSSMALRSQTAGGTSTKGSKSVVESKLHVENALKTRLSQCTKVNHHKHTHAKKEEIDEDLLIDYEYGI